MSTIVDKGIKWGKTALALKLGKTVIKRGGMFGIGIGAVAGAGYLAYNLYERYKKTHPGVQSEKTGQTDTVGHSDPKVKGDNTIVI